MKKKLEADLMSIAHRILQLKNKDDLKQLYLECQKLHEKLAVLLFIEENFDEVKPTISKKEVEEKVALVFEDSKKEASLKNELLIEEPESKVLETTIIENEAVEQSTSLDIKEIETKIDSEIEINEPIVPAKETFFDKVTIQSNEAEKETKKNIKFVDIPKPTVFVFDKVTAVNLNDKLKKSIDIGLNDKIAFEQNLFGGSTEDYNRVISQISTFDSLQEAQNFINNLVKPDYNNWIDKDEFANRFMEIVENKFS